MPRFTGSFEDLQAIVNASGVPGTWSETGNAQCFRSEAGGVLLWYPSTKTLQPQGKPAAKEEIAELIVYIESNLTAPATMAAPTGSPVFESARHPRLFVVYGHNTVLRDQLELILVRLGIEHLILAKSNTNGDTIIEALENHIGKDGSASAGIVLMTPDDMGYALNAGPDSIKPRARQNVVLELGMVMAKLGRPNTIIVVAGGIERPSDTDGILYMSVKDHMREIVPQLVERLDEIGFEIDHKKITAAMR